MNFDVRAENAQLLDRDDIQAAVTGDIAIRSDGEGGTISGDVRVNQGRFRLGSATAAARCRGCRCARSTGPTPISGPRCGGSIPGAWRSTSPRPTG